MHLAGALADAGEHRVASVRLGDVVDELHNEHSLADTGAAEEADLASLRVRRKKVHNLIKRKEVYSLGCTRHSRCFLERCSYTSSVRAHTLAA